MGNRRIMKKKIRITPIPAAGFAVNGVDVSHYQGTEKYIDKNVFRRTKDELRRLMVLQKKQT